MLENPGTQTFPETRDTFDISLTATDPNVGDVLTFSGTAEGAEFHLDQTLGLNFTGDFSENVAGLGEKWLLAEDGRTWYYIEPNGDFWRWLGGSFRNRELVAALSGGIPTPSFAG